MLIGVGIGAAIGGVWHQGSYVPTDGAVNMAALGMPAMQAQQPMKVQAPMRFSAPAPLRGVAAKASQVSGNAVKEAQLKKMTEDKGFISALDESGGTSPKTLAAYGVTDKDGGGSVTYKDNDEMMSMVHDLRAKIMTN